VKNKIISVLNRDMLKEPFTILDEFLPAHIETPVAKNRRAGRYTGGFAKKIRV
jgi:hypothetical protein